MKTLIHRHHLRRIGARRKTPVILPEQQTSPLPLTAQRKAKVLVLLFNQFWGEPIHATLSGAELPQGWEVTDDRSRFREAAVVIFHVPELRSLLGIPRIPGQIWVGHSMESPLHRPYQDFLDRFDVTMTYKQDADVFCSYVPSLTDLEPSLRPNPTESVPAVFVASNWIEHSGRTKYVARLMRSMQVDSYGKCLANRPLPVDRGFATKLEIISRYRFNLAFENCIEPDYVTEKFFHPLIAGTIPVYLGAPNIEEFAPGDNCFIDARNFPNPRHLADYLKDLAQNDRECARYHEWRKRPLRTSFLSLAARSSRNPFTRLFELIQKRFEG